MDVFYLFKFEVLGKTADLHMEIVQNMAFWDQSEKNCSSGGNGPEIYKENAFYGESSQI